MFTLTRLALSRSDNSHFLKQARFPDSRLKRAASRPSQSPKRDQWPNCWKLRNRRYTVAGTVWAFHPTSLVTHL